MGEGLEFVVKDMAEAVFDLGNGGSVELNSAAGQFPRESVLC
jgi:hypothetical protein